MCHGQMIPLAGQSSFERRCAVCKGIIPAGEKHTILSVKIRGESRSLLICTNCSIAKAQADWQRRGFQ